MKIPEYLDMARHIIVVSQQPTKESTEYRLKLNIAKALSDLADKVREEDAKVAQEIVDFFKGSREMHPLHQREMETASSIAQAIRAKKINQ